VLAPAIDVGILYVFALGSLAVYGVILAGWSANNKYSLLGALRSSAQIISYEIPLGMSVLGVFLIVGSLNLETIAGWQADHRYWLVLVQPLAFMLFPARGLCRRKPVAVRSARGGAGTRWRLPHGILQHETRPHAHGRVCAPRYRGVHRFDPVLRRVVALRLETLLDGKPVAAAVLKAVILIGKMLLYCGFALVIRWTIPRFRFDQLMSIAWKVMIPLAIANLVFVIIVKQYHWPLAWLTVTSIGLVMITGLWHGSGDDAETCGEKSLRWRAEPRQRPG